MPDLTFPTPKGVYLRNGRYYRVVKNRWIALTRRDEGIAALHRALRDTPIERDPETVGELLARYLPQAEISATTRREYTRIIDSRLMHHFGRMRIGAVRPNLVAAYLEKRKRDGHGPMGNRERAVLSSAFEFAMRNKWAEFNPCVGVRRNKERRRERYVTDVEFLAAFEAAPEPLQDVLALALLTGARQGDLRKLRREDLRPDGIYMLEGKTESTTGKRRLVAWSDALRFFVRRALERQERIAAREPDPRKHRQRRTVSEYVLTNRFNRPWTMSGLQSAVKRMPKDWHFHDIRAKSASDAGHNILGHGAQMLGVYVRERKVAALR
jgi:integrase